MIGPSLTVAVQDYVMMSSYVIQEPEEPTVQSRGAATDTRSR
jgi:hypothetical protein